MKSLLKLILTLIFVTTELLGQQHVPTPMCSDVVTVETTDEATCTGSASCRACKNCKYCGYCAERGGSCGVCARPTQTYRASSPTPRVNSYGTLPAARSSNEATPDDRMTNQPHSEYYLKRLVVENTATLNLRAGPGTSFDVIRRLYQGDRMTFLAMEDGWVKVRLEEGSLIGFVSARYVAVL